VKPRVLLIYHFFHPDTVVSARIFSDLAQELARQGFDVTVFTSNRLIRGDRQLAADELWEGVKIRRFSRPNLNQASHWQRLVNSAILQAKWLWGFRKRRHEFDAVILGTDPQFAYMMFPFLRLLNRKVKLVHWAFDLYPEVVFANSPMWMRALSSFALPFARLAYRCVDLMADIGGCMRKRLERHRHQARKTTLTPWALVEPATIPTADPQIRLSLFGNARLGLLYSGTVGYAHDLAPFITLARECRRRQLDIAFCFAGYGNQYAAQTALLTPEDTNVRIAGFASEAELEQRLAAADLHLISLRPGWAGTVVPSKFFGALAIGRPVIFSGDPQSCLRHWTEDYRLGSFLADDGAATIAFLENLLQHPEELAQLQRHAFERYQQEFSRHSVTQRWIAELTPL
jgi:glycosyltransferase involved in cell wall biosynthesis